MEKKEIEFKSIIQKIASRSTNFHDPIDETEHMLYQGNTSKQPDEILPQIRFFRKSICVAKATFTAYNRIERVPEGSIVRHKCRYKYCTNIKCLEIGTIQENAMDRIRDGTQIRGEKHPLAKITEEIAIKIKQTKGIGTFVIRSKFFNVSRNIIATIQSGKTWAHITNYPENPQLISDLKSFI